MKLDKETAAASVFFGAFDSTYLDTIFPELIETETPESKLLTKAKFDSLSAEANEMLSTILKSPKEMFFNDGRIKKTKLFRQLKKKYKLSWRLIYSAEMELKKLLEN